MSARILVVDDIPVNVKLLHARLTAEYFDVVTAEDGPSALRAVEAETPDIVLLDVMMPGMTGFEVCRRLKQDPRFSHIPVVMVTALDTPEDRLQGLEAGADEFLTKPVNDLALFARVRSLVRLKRLIDEWRMREETSARLGSGGDAAALVDVPGSEGALLVVASNQRLRERIDRALSEDRHAITVESDVDAAREKVFADTFDTLVIDLAVEAGDALRLCSQIRAHEPTRHLPILLIGDSDGEVRLIKGLELGVNDYIMRPIDGNELRARVRAQVRRRRFQIRLHAMHEASLAKALTDGLTGLYNRHYLGEHLGGLARQAETEGRPLSVALLDADHFKAVNDTHGHAVGDEVLQEIARRLTRNLRGFDFVARYGGEEFLVVMPDSPIEAAARVAERLRGAIANVAVPAEGGRVLLQVTASFGVASFGGAGDTVEAMLDRADQALYDAKRSGRNRVAVDQAGCQARQPASAASL